MDVASTLIRCSFNGIHKDDDSNKVIMASCYAHNLFSASSMIKTLPLLTRIR